MSKREIWKSIYGGVYAVSSLGRVRRIRNMRGSAPTGLLKSSLRSGYPSVCICIDGRQYSRTVHGLMAEAFLGKCPEGKVTNHRSGRKTDNWIENLEYVTHQENSRHAVQTGLSRVGSRHYSAKLVESDILDIRKLYRPRDGQKLAHKYGVSKTLIVLIVRRKIWKHI